MDNDTFKFYLNGVLLTTQRFVGITGNDWYPWVYNDDNGYSWRLNFGQDASFGGARERRYYYADSFNFGRFAYQPPTGYMPLSSESTCLIDTDGDGAEDCYDGCPLDASLQVKGLCGCAPCQTADRCYTVRDFDFSLGETTAFTAASSNDEQAGLRRSMTTGMLMAAIPITQHRPVTILVFLWLVVLVR